MGTLGPKDVWDPLSVPRTGLICGKEISSCLSGHLCAYHCLAFPDHVTREKLDRILAVIQGSHQKALVT